VGVLVCALVAALGTTTVLAPDAGAEQASQPGVPAAGRVDAGVYHSCALLDGGTVRCWGYGGTGQLGYGNTNNVGDDETPASVGPVDLGVGRTAAAIVAGDYHTCALLDDGTVRCWGYGGDGRLGYGNTNNVGDKPTATPALAGPVNLGAGRTAKAITAGGGHTCALLDDGSVRCWGYGGTGQLGYGNTNNVGDDETPGSVGPVDLGSGRKALAISAGTRHTCALLDNGSVRCWGHNIHGELGYATVSTPGKNENDVGDNETPGSVGPVDLGPGRTATGISAGDTHTCALLDDATVRCWGYGATGQLGYGNRDDIGDNETPGSVGPVDLGPGRSAIAISAGGPDSCALLDDRTVRCWGYGGDGELGYGNTNNVGDDETPGPVGPVDLGVGRTATAISAGQDHTCALLDDNNVRCWGNGLYGRLGYCNEERIGDDELPGSVGPVDLGAGGAGCASPPTNSATSTPSSAPSTPAKTPSPVSSDAVRAHGLRSCLVAVARRAQRESSRARRSSARGRAMTRRHAATGRALCLRIFGRIPGRPTGLRARTLGTTEIELEFNAAGTDANHPPPARSYRIEQSRRPIRNARDFARAQTLCKGRCRFGPSQVGGKILLTVTDLHPHTTYYYAVAARDNVSAQRGPRSQTVKARTG